MLLVHVPNLFIAPAYPYLNIHRPIYFMYLIIADLFDLSNVSDLSDLSMNPSIYLSHNVFGFVYLSMCLSAIQSAYICMYVLLS